jgi:hypothetical protein
VVAVSPPPHALHASGRAEGTRLEPRALVGPHHRRSQVELIRQVAFAHLRKMVSRLAAPNASGSHRYVRSCKDLVRKAGVSLGEILYQTSASFPFGSMRKADRSIPMYLRPYIDFSFQTS